MKSLIEYIQEKLIINKNYNDGYKYHPESRDELEKIIKDHYNNNQYDLNDIDVSKITDFSKLFLDDKNTGDPEFDISDWNVSNGENFYYMFYDCKNFNCNLSNWDVSSGKIFSGMFEFCETFNCDLSNCNVSKVEYMQGMFNSCKKLKSVGDISRWKVFKVQIMINMFKGSAITNIPSWYKE